MDFSEPEVYRCENDKSGGVSGERARILSVARRARFIFVQPEYIVSLYLIDTCILLWNKHADHHVKKMYCTNHKGA